MGKVAKTAPSQVGQTSVYSPQQQALINELAMQARQALGTGAFDITQQPLFQQGAEAISGFITSSPEQLEKQYQTQFVEPSMMQFQREVIPSIEQRFANLGGTRSSAIHQTLGAAGEELATRLAAQRAALIDQAENRKLQAINQAYQYGAAPIESQYKMAQLGLQPYQIPIIQPGTEGILSSVLRSGVNVGAAALGGLL